MERAGMFSLDTIYATDVEFWFRLLEHGDLYWDRSIIGYYRIHGKAASVNQWKATSRYFMQVAEEQVRKGVVSLSPLEMRFVGFRVYAQGLARQFLYQMLG